MTTFTLPMPPSSNRLWRTIRGRAVLSQEAKDYKLTAALLARQTGIVPLSGDVAVFIDVYRARAAGDLDNKLKILLDALIGVAYEDDRQIVQIHAYRHDLPKEKGKQQDGYVTVRVEGKHHE